MCHDTTRPTLIVRSFWEWHTLKYVTLNENKKGEQQTTTREGGANISMLN